MSNTQIKLTSFAVAITSMLACTSATVESDSIDNEAIWAGIRITSEDGLTSGINVELNVGGSTGTNLVLSSGDRVVVSSGSEEVELEEDTDLFDVDYEGVINVGGSGDEITVRLERPGSTDISNSRVTLPDTFTIDFPQQNQIFTTLADIEILWTAGTATDNVLLEQTATCKDAANQDVTIVQSNEVADSGSYTTNFPTSGLTDFVANDSCNYSIQITRTNSGTLDAGFGEGGFIRGRQVREVTGMTIDTQ